MVEEKVTANLIINTMKGWVENREIISPDRWLDASSQLNLLRGDLDDELYKIEHNLAVEKANILSVPEMTVGKATALIEAKPEFLQKNLLRAKLRQIEEFIRIAKRRASLKENEWSHS